MKRSPLVVLAIALALAGGYFIARSTASKAGTASPGLYRCAMHPSYTAERPGDCPICGMHLTKMPQPAQASDGLRPSVTEQERSGLATTRISRRRLRRNVAATGEMVLNSPATLNAPVDGAILTINVAAEGPNPVPVQKNQLALVIQPSQSAHLPGPVEIRSPAQAWMTVNVAPNAPVKEGFPLAYYTSVELLPVIAEIPPESIDLVKKGAYAEMTADTNPGQVWTGSVTNLLGIYSEKTRAAKIKLEFPNRSLNMRSNMPVHVRIRYEGPPVLTIPEDAVLWTGQHWICYVAESPGRFRAHELAIGAQAEGLYQVHSGVREGDRVVSKAAFLLDSESRLRTEIDR